MLSLHSILGNILDDEVLIDTLGDSKKTSNIIQEKVKVAELTQTRIAKVRAGYVPVAFQGEERPMPYVLCPNDTPSESSVMKTSSSTHCNTPSQHLL